MNEFIKGISVEITRAQKCPMVKLSSSDSAVRTAGHDAADDSAVAGHASDHLFVNADHGADDSVVASHAVGDSVIEGHAADDAVVAGHACC